MRTFGKLQNFCSNFTLFESLVKMVGSKRNSYTALRTLAKVAGSGNRLRVSRWPTKAVRVTMRLQFTGCTVWFLSRYRGSMVAPDPPRELELCAHARGNGAGPCTGPLRGAPTDIVKGCTQNAYKACRVLGQTSPAPGGVWSLVSMNQQHEFCCKPAGHHSLPFHGTVRQGLR